MIEFCHVCARAVLDCEWQGNHPQTPSAMASDQIVDATLELDRHADTYLRWPWKALDELYGAMAPGQLHYVAGFSGMGKTTFISSAMGRWVEQGRKVVVLPLEQKAHTFRTYMACQSLGVDPGLMLSGDFHRLPTADTLRAQVKQAVADQLKDPFLSRMTVLGAPDVSVETLRRAVKYALEREADVLVIDHVDHLQPNEPQRSGYDASRAVNDEALRLAQNNDLLIVAMSQCNQQSMNGSSDKLAKYEPPRDNHVLMGGKKRELATGMLGLFRPQLPPPEGATQEDMAAWREDMARARRGELEPHKALEPMTMGIVLMKSRSYGNREGKRIKLAWRAGRIVDHETLPYSLRRVS